MLKTIIGIDEIEGKSNKSSRNNVLTKNCSNLIKSKNCSNLIKFKNLT